MTDAKGAGIDGASVLLGAALGLGVGAVLGWYISRQQMEKEIEREVSGVKEYYADKVRVAADPDRDAAAEGSEATMADPDGVRGARVITKFADPRIELVLHPAHPALEGLEEVGPGDDTEDDDEDEDLDDSPPEPVVRDPTKPYVITIEEFTTENEDYNKISLTYYTVDDALCDERNAPIRDTSIIGVGFEDLFGQDPREPDLLHVRNEALTADFEIARRNESFTESVLGYKKPI